MDSDLIFVYCAGTARVNGRYRSCHVSSSGRPIFRKTGSNIGILRFDENTWYISDCGDDFTPAGADHLDFYSSETTSNVLSADFVWNACEDGSMPGPKVKLGSESTARTLVAALRSSASVYASKGDAKQAIIHLQSVLAIGPATMDDYLSLASLLLENGDAERAWETMGDLSRKDFLFSRDCFTLAHRKKGSEILIGCNLASSSISDIVKRLVGNISLLRFLDFTLLICDTLRVRLGEGSKFKEHCYTEEAISRLEEISEARREFQLAGGLELAIGLRGLYRDIERFTFDTRDVAVCRMKIFSLTDSLRQFSSDGKLDAKGRDGTFKNFWEVGLAGPDDDPVVDPKEQEARAKDSDPAKEVKCSVIKNINEGNESESDLMRFAETRKRLLSGVEKTYSIPEIQKHDCNNSVLKLISIHGVIFDVTHNLEKYAPDGEYFFFPGHDITYPLAVSSLSGDFVDQLYKLESVEHLKRVYGWMDYFEKKYKVVARLAEYADEDAFPAPPQGDEQPEMQCTIM